jgi:hypothetical protein
MRVYIMYTTVSHRSGSGGELLRHHDETHISWAAAMYLPIFIRYYNR